MLLYNGITTLRTDKQSGYVEGPWGPNSQQVKYPANAITLSMWADLGWLPLVEVKPEAGYRAVSPWTITLNGDHYDKVPASWEKIPYAASIEEAKDKKREAIHIEKNRVRDGGFTVNEILWDSDYNARTAYLEVAMRLQIDPSWSTQWKASEGIWVTMDAATYDTVAAAGEAHIQAVFAWASSKDTEINAANTIEEVEAINEQYS